MPHKLGKSRLQYGLFATPLEEMIEADNLVRIIDAFVDTLDLAKCGFQAVESKERGAPPYEPAVLLKIYVYGYFNRIRSSRRLEAECGRNIELMWLSGCQNPSYHTISTFRSRKEHRSALKEVFRSFNRFCQPLGLFGQELVAIDGTKMRAQNSKKNNLSEEKLQRRLDRVDTTFEAYLDELDAADAAGLSEGEVNRDAVFAAMEELIERKKKFLLLQEQLRQAKEVAPGTTQISLTDPDARMLPVNNLGATEVAYNVQSAVDDKHCLIAHYEISNQLDDYLLAPVAVETKAQLGVESLTVLADKGYHTGASLHECAEKNITTYVAVPEYGYSGKGKGFRKEDFKYDAELNVYICKAGQQLTTNNQWYEKHGRNGQLQARFKKYQAYYPTCLQCPFAELCLADSNVQHRHGRAVERSEYEEAVVANRRRIINNRSIYKRRQAIVEHPFGTIKRSWGFTYTLLKGMEKVSGEFALIFTAYNLRRVVSIVGVKTLLEALKTPNFKFFVLRRTMQQEVYTINHSMTRRAA